MKRSRKWIYVQQEAQRLASIGASAAEIARRLEVNQGSVSRWIKSGKLRMTRQKVADPLGVTPDTDRHDLQSPGEWAAVVRATFDFDATDDQLVTAGRLALETMHDGNAKTSERLSASAEFRAIVKQLALIARSGGAVEKPTETPKRPTLRVVPKRSDPRRSIA